MATLVDLKAGKSMELNNSWCQSKPVLGAMSINELAIIKSDVCLGLRNVFQ